MIEPRTTVVDRQILEICSAVGRGWLTEQAGADSLVARLAPAALGSSDRNRLSVVAVELVEALLPESAGLLLDDEEKARLSDGRSPDRLPADVAARWLAILLCGCLQLVARDDTRTGARAIGRWLDRVTPE